MATVITEECINCGACEPECPNTAIYAGGVEWELDGVRHPPLSDSIFYIVPEKCTECVGFYDHEACAAVCPVDCCVPDPNRPESEEVLIERARRLHPEREFGVEFPSRFRKAGESAGAVAPAVAEGARAPSVEAPKAEAAPAPARATPAPPSPPAPPPPSAAPEPAVALSMPPLEEWEIPIACFRCQGEYAVAYRHFRPGVVFYCPHCSASYVPTTEIYEEVSRALRGFHESWTRAFEEFHERRRRELESFEAKQRAELERFEASLRRLTRELRPPGVKPRFRWFG